MPDLSGLAPFLQLFIACSGAYFVALWVSLIIWTFRDMQARTHETLAVVLSAVLVAVFTIPGLAVLFWRKFHRREQPVAS